MVDTAKVDPRLLGDDEFRIGSRHHATSIVILV
jgi:hypothetical protein